MSDLLKEAIADAKAVRETALQNAKMALEEAFTPQLKSMLSAKLKEDEIEESDPVVEDDEMDDEDDAEEGRMSDGEHDDEEAEEGMHDDEAEEGMHDEDMDDDDEAEEGRHEEDDEDDVEEGIIEVDGVKYAPIVAEKEDDDEDAEEGRVDEDNLDLESVIKELESELSEGEDEDDDKEEVKEETVEEEYEIDESLFEEGEEEELDEVDKSSDIGKSDNNRGGTDTSSAIRKGGQEKSKKMESVQAELKEYKEAVSFLKNKLHEVNILNAKLLFTNKLFKEYALDNNQKLRVVETFDRAQTTREIKLVYSTLCEQFGDNGSIVTKKSIKESASAKTGSTKPQKKIISEESNVADRFRQLAGIIK